MRSFWKIPKAALTVDVEGAPSPAFAGIVVYDTTPTLAFVMADLWDRPDIEAAGGTREDLSVATSRKRYLRTSIRRTIDDEDTVIRVKASNVRMSDEVLQDVDVPAVLFAGDTIEDVIGSEALAEASSRMEKAAATEGP